MRYNNIKYVVFAGDNLILTLKGFVNANLINDNQVRLFNKPVHAREFIAQSKYCNCQNLYIRKIIVTLQEVEDYEIMAL